MDSRAAPKTVDALVNRLDMALERWFFENELYREVWELLDPHMVNILV